ncbi:MAG: site-specific DNA-methyltransferase [Candidatus Thorarchaeota archaeon]|nr:site-specific DNA-methyltransferase [Candidatus Thorarchaeota archaeon]
MKSLPKSSIDLIVADPPFGIGFDGKSGVYNRDDTLVIPGYREAQGSYAEFTKDWIAQLPRIMKKDASAYIFSGWTNLDAILNGASEAGLTTLNHLIWHYPFGVYTKRKFVTSHYHVVLLVKNAKSYYFNKIENYPEDVWIVKRKYRAGKEKNSTKLPLEVVSKCIDFSSRPGDVVLDPFMGNGTTAVAAKAAFRHFIGFEINDQLKPLLKEEINSVTPGQFFKSYKERLPTIEELAEKYPRAYREYLKQKGQRKSIKKVMQ